MRVMIDKIDADMFRNINLDDLDEIVEVHYATHKTTKSMGIGYTVNGGRFKSFIGSDIITRYMYDLGVSDLVVVDGEIKSLRIYGCMDLNSLLQIIIGEDELNKCSKIESEVTDDFITLNFVIGSGN